mgnify:CR=1 FL=1
MTLTMQIFFGSVMLTICALIHVGMFAVSLPGIQSIDRRTENLRVIWRNASMIGASVLMVVAAHTVQIWFWAWAFFHIDAFDSFTTGFYFATVTYTTVGYGDLVLGEDARIFAAFAAVTGMLTFGISTAILLGLVLRLLNISSSHET